MQQSQSKRPSIYGNQVQQSQQKEIKSYMQYFKKISSQVQSLNSRVRTIDGSLDQITPKIQRKNKKNHPIIKNSQQKSPFKKFTIQQVKKQQIQQKQRKTEQQLSQINQTLSRLTNFLIDKWVPSTKNQENKQINNYQKRLQKNYFQKQKAKVVQKIDNQKLQASQLDTNDYCPDYEPRLKNVTVLIPQEGCSKDQLLIWVGRMCKKVLSVGFNLFKNNQLDISKAKVFCSQNIIRNLIKLPYKLKKYWQEIDKCLKTELFPYYRNNYPQTQEKGVSKLAGLLIQRDIINQNQHDLLSASGVEFKFESDGNYNSQIMEFLNFIMKIPNLPEGLKQQKNIVNKNSLGKLFKKEMEKLFEFVQYQQNMLDIQSFNPKKNERFDTEKALQQIVKYSVLRQQIYCQKFINDLFKVKGQKEYQKPKQKISNESQKQYQKQRSQIAYKQKIKSFTSKQIGFKLPENLQPFQDYEIKDGNLKLKNSYLMRVVTKWCQELQKYFDPKEILNRQTPWRMKDKSEKYLKKNQMIALNTLLQRQWKKINLQLQKIKQNNYKNQVQYSQNQIPLQLKKFCEQEAVVGQFCCSVFKINEAYLIKYLNMLIHGINLAIVDFEKLLKYQYHQYKIESQKKNIIIQNQNNILKQQVFNQFTDEENSEQNQLILQEKLINLQTNIKKQRKKRRLEIPKKRQNKWGNISIIKQSKDEITKVEDNIKQYHIQKQSTLKNQISTQKQPKVNSFMVPSCNNLSHKTYKIQSCQNSNNDIQEKQQQKNKNNKKKYFNQNQQHINQQFRNKLINSQVNSWSPQIITFKIGDLLRCKCTSKESQIIALYKLVEYISQTRPQFLKIIRVKNKLDKGNKDILMNILYRNSIVVEMQLAIKSDKSKFIECSNKFNHYFYELQRAQFGSIMEMCNIWVSHDQRSKFYLDKINQYNKRNAVQKLEDCCMKLQNIQEINLPFKCIYCNRNYYENNFYQKHFKCKGCAKLVCSCCRVNKSKLKDIKQIFPVLKHDKELIEGNEQKFSKLPQDGGKILNLNSKQKRIKSFKAIIDKNQCLLLRQIYKPPIQDDKKAPKMEIELIKEYKFKEQSFKRQDEQKKQKKQQLIEWYNSLLIQNLIFKSEHVQQRYKNFTKQQVKQLYFLPKYFKGIQRYQKRSVALIKKQLKDQSIKQIKNKLYSVKTINFSQNKLLDLKILIEKFPNVKFAILNNNKFTKVINDNTQNDWGQNLVELYLQQNKIQDIQGIVSFRKLVLLNLSKNRIQKIPQNIFIQLKQLKQLDLSHNQIRQMHHKLTQKDESVEFNLRSLNISHNFLQMLSNQIFMLQRLKYLDISQNKLACFPQEIRNLRNLAILNISSNQLTGLPGQIGYLQFLTQLNISSNKINKLPCEISKIKSLKRLNIQKNFLISLPIQIGQLQKLNYLNISQNLLDSLPNQIGNLQCLTVLNISFNQFYKLPKIINNLDTLELLDISYNKLTTLPKQFGKKFINIKQLILNCNYLSEIPQLLQSLRSLEKLSIDVFDFNEIIPVLDSLDNLEQLIIISYFPIKALSYQTIYIQCALRDISLKSYRNKSNLLYEIENDAPKLHKSEQDAEYYASRYFENEKIEQESDEYEYEDGKSSKNNQH